MHGTLVMAQAGDHCSTVESLYAINIKSRYLHVGARKPKRVFVSGRCSTLQTA